MSNEIKVSLTITGIEGSTRHFAGKKKMKTVFQFKDRRNNKLIEKEMYYKVPSYEYIPVTKRMNLTKDFFDYATSKECPNWFSAYGTRKDLVRKWEKMSWKERLETHLLLICLDNGGKDFSYNILDD